jgi:transposase
MQGAYSKDLRERVIRAVAGGRSCHAAAAIFGVSVASAIRWVHRHRTTGETQARPRGGSKPRTLVGERAWLLARIAQKPDVTLRALVAELAARGTKASYYAVWQFFAREGYTFKKKPARQRTKAPGRSASARPVAALSGPDRSKALRVHR